MVQSDLGLQGQVYLLTQMDRMTLPETGVVWGLGAPKVIGDITIR